MPKFSIIVPVYKTENYLKRNIESILSQTVTDWEAILVDDGSPDNSGAICDEYSYIDSRIRVIHKQNGGVSTARNAGLDVSFGEWVCFVDSDDWIEPTYLENFMITGWEDCQLLMQSFNKFSLKTGKTEAIILPNCSFEGSDRVVTFLENFSGVHNGLIWHRLFRLNIIKEHKCRFPESISFGEDGWFFFDYMRYVKQTKISSKVGYNYLVRSSSLTSLGRKHPFKIYHYLLEHYVSTLLSYNVPTIRESDYFNFVRQYSCRLWSCWYVDLALNRHLECNYILMDLDSLNRKYHLYDVDDLLFFYEKIQVWTMKYLCGNFRIIMLRFSQIIKKVEMAIRRRLPL